MQDDVNEDTILLYRGEFCGYPCNIIKLLNNYVRVI